MSRREPLASLWDNPWVRLISYAGLIAVAVWLINFFSELLTSFVAAFLLAYICDPLIDWFERRRIRRSLGILLMLLLLALLLTLIVLFVLPGLAQEAGRLSERANDYALRISGGLIPWIENTFDVQLPRSYSEAAQGMWANQEALTWIAQKLRQPATAFATRVFSSLSNLVVTLLWVLLVPVAWIYLLKDIDPLLARAKQMLPLRRRDWILERLARIDEALGNFLRGQFTVCAILAVLYAVGLKWVAGVPLGGTIGIVAGLISFVPYLGLVLGIVPALLLAWLEHGDLLHPLLVVSVFTVVQLLEGNLITPKIVGDKLGLHPVLVIFFIMVWGQLLGFLGVLLALPLTAVLKVFWPDLIKWYSVKYLNPVKDKGDD